MLSSGRPGLDNVFSLREGVLRLEVDKETYERMGLAGNAIQGNGRKHVKTRYGKKFGQSRYWTGNDLADCTQAIELNLRQPSMVRGKHGFEKIVWAFKNVLKDTVTWLFYDINGKNDGSGPIAKHQPKIRKAEMEEESMAAVQVPEPTEEIQEGDYDTANELLEWLSLATMCSPRIQSTDKIDTYLSRYRPPGDSDSDGGTMKCTTQDLVRFQWHGFLPDSFVRKIFIASMKASGSGWFGMTASGFDGNTYTILQRNHHTMTWEYMD